MSKLQKAISYNPNAGIEIRYPWLGTQCVSIFTEDGSIFDAEVLSGRLGPYSSKTVYGNFSTTTIGSVLPAELIEVYVEALTQLTEHLSESKDGVYGEWEVFYSQETLVFSKNKGPKSFAKKTLAVLQSK